MLSLSYLLLIHRKKKKNQSAATEAPEQTQQDHSAGIEAQASSSKQFGGGVWRTEIYSDQS